ncbi:MAG: hypothetical protein ACYCQI_00835 [Gammaproteobacteria bacterium]
MGSERKVSSNQDDKKSAAAEGPAAKVYKPGMNWCTFSPYRSRYLGIVSEKNDSISVIDCLSSESMQKTRTLKHSELIAVGSLHHSEILLTVSCNSIKFWDKTHLAQVKPREPASEFVFETRFLCGSLKEAPSWMSAQLHVLPDDQSIIIAKKDSKEIMIIDLVNKKSDIFTMDFVIRHSAFVEPHYLALGHENGIHLYNVLEKDYLKNPPLFKFDVPNLREFLIWPGGHLWAIGQDFRNTRYTICEFIPDQPLKPLIKLPEIIASGKYASPVITAGNFCYCPKGDPRDLLLKSLDPQTGITSLLKTANPKEEICFIFSTIRGVCADYWDGYLQFFALKEPPLLTQQELKETILSKTTLAPDPANMIAAYAFEYAPEFFAPAKQPQPDKKSDVIADLRNFIKEFSYEPKYREELKQLLSAILEKGERTYADCFDGCRELIKLVLEKEKTHLHYFSDKERELATFLILVKNLDEPMSDFKLVPR